MPILNIGITTHFREVKHVDFLLIAQIRNPMGPDFNNTNQKPHGKKIFICFVECFPLREDDNKDQ